MGRITDLRVWQVLYSITAFKHFCVLVTYSSKCFCQLKCCKTLFSLLRVKMEQLFSLGKNIRWSRKVKFQREPACGILRLFASENCQCVRGINKTQEIKPSTGIQWIHTSSYNILVPPHIKAFRGGVQDDFMLWQCNSKFQCFKSHSVT